MLEEEKKEEERSLAFLKSVRLEVAAALLVLIVSQENTNPLRLFSHFHELQMTNLNSGKSRGSGAGRTS